MKRFIFVSIFCAIAVSGYLLTIEGRIPFSRQEPIVTSTDTVTVNEETFRHDILPKTASLSAKIADREIYSVKRLWNIWLIEADAAPALAPLKRVLYAVMDGSFSQIGGSVKQAGCRLEVPWMYVSEDPEQRESQNTGIFVVEERCSDSTLLSLSKTDGTRIVFSDSGAFLKTYPLSEVKTEIRLGEYIPASFIQEGTYHGRRAILVSIMAAHSIGVVGYALLDPTSGTILAAAQLDHY